MKNNLIEPMSAFRVRVSIVGEGVKGKHCVRVMKQTRLFFRYFVFEVRVGDCWRRDALLWLVDDNQVTTQIRHLLQTLATN